MPRNRRSYNNRRRWSRPDYGREAALRHIADAQELSEELAGTDRAVKQYLFSLSGAELRRLLDSYEAISSPVARDYAEQTLPAWRSGKRQMSGTVAERFYDVLPPVMPLTTKYSIAETLWNHYGPSSDVNVKIGNDVTLGELLDEVEAHIISTVMNYQIPDDLSERFDWLASGDVSVRQQILNYLRQLERDAVVRQSRERIKIMLETYFENPSEVVQQYKETLQVGKHKLTLTPVRASVGIEFERNIVETPTILSKSTGKSEPTFWETSTGGMIGWAIVAVVALFIILGVAQN